MIEDDDYAYRFEFPDKSSFHIYADGRYLLVFEDGRRETRAGVITNRIPLLIGRAAKPRQDRIEQLEAQLETMRAALERAGLRIGEEE